jgi:hypothetical protein
MGHGSFGRGSYDKALSRIIEGKYKYIVQLIPEEKTNEQLFYNFELFEELDEQRIKDYAEKVAELNSVHEKIKFSSAKVFSLEGKALPDLKL